MKKSILLFTFIFFGTYVFSEDTNKTNEKFYNQCLNPTVKIFNIHTEISGSGFITRSIKKDNEWQNSIITAEHVVKNYNGFWIETPEDQKKYKLYVYQKDVENDVAVGFFVSEKQMPTVQFDFESKVEINKEIFHVGYPLMDDIRSEPGIITNAKTVKPFYYKGLIRTNAFALMGDSGGPLFLKNTYGVIGICTAIRTHEKQFIGNISYYQPISAIKKLNEKSNNSLESVYNKSINLPVIPFIKIKFDGYAYKLPEVKDHKENYEDF